MAPVRAALVAAVLIAAAVPALGCVGIKTVVANTGTAPAVKPENPEDVYDVSGVRQHFDALLPFTDFRSNAGSTYSCVDSRGEKGQLGTLGGDMAELAGGIHTYLKLTNAAGDVAPIVKDIFKAFMDQIATPERPFYFHTSDEKLHKVFKAVNEAGKFEPKVTVFPETMPTTPSVSELWLKKLTNGSYQGCGHVRLMIDQFADYGLDSPAVPQALVKAFYEYWWPTPLGSAERSKVKFAVLQGPLDGKAVTIVDSAGACPGKSPAAVPSHGGSQVFVYHGKAVEDFRALTLAPFFVKYAQSKGKALDKAKFTNELKSLQGKQLGATLTNLAPANSLPLVTVTITSVEAGGAAAAANAAANLGMLNSAPNLGQNQAAARNSAAANAAPKNAPPKNAAPNAAAKNAAAPNAAAKNAAARNAAARNAAGRKM